ncbi:MAG: hypothetical protein ABEH35_00860 [Haloarculaceae archaeon]
MVDVFTATVGSLFSLVGLAVLAWRVDDVRTLHRILRGDPVSIRDLETTTGPVEIEGTARTDEVTVEDVYVYGEARPATGGEWSSDWSRCWRRYDRDRGL